MGFEGLKIDQYYYDDFRYGYEDECNSQVIE